MKLIELFDKPEKWIKGGLFKDAAGESQGMEAKDTAVRFCVRGGVIKLCGDWNYKAQDVEDRITEVIRKRYNSDAIHDRGWRTGINLIIDWNNDPATTWEEFRSVLEEAGV